MSSDIEYDSADEASRTTSKTYDLVILGGGSGGYACALRAAELGLDVVLVEQDKVGGTCLHRGCIPTKALLHAGEVADGIREADVFGIQATLDGIELTKVNDYKAAVVDRLYQGLRGLLSGRKITVVEGTGRLEGADVIAVGDETYRGRHVVLASGSYSKTLPGLEIDGERIVTSEQALDLKRVPESAIVLGGGVIGVEFASAWTSFGTEVTIIEALPRLAPTEDEACSTALERAFRKRKIRIQTGAPFAGVELVDDGVRLRTEDGETHDAEILLVAVGRGPTTEGLGYEEHGVALDRGFVVTDERLRTTAPGVYAVGDIVAGLQLAHRGFQHGIFVAEDIAGLAPAPIDESGIPRVTYSDPEIAAVGVSETQAVEAFGRDAVTTYTYDLGGNGKSQILKTSGFVKLVRRIDGPVVGVHMVGARVGELVGEAQLIVNWDAFPSDVAGLVHMHPTQGEALGEAHLALAGKPLHAHS
jgi:dihydrolipoamide dehydrogenase